jgi:hypothetical protein
VGRFGPRRDLLRIKTETLLTGIARRSTIGPSPWFSAPLSLARFERSPRSYYAVIRILARIWGLRIDNEYDFAHDLLTRPARIQKLLINAPNSFIIFRVYTFCELVVKSFQFLRIAHPYDHPLLFNARVICIV